MKTKRILSTKILNKDELNQLDVDGHEVHHGSYGCCDCYGHGQP